MTPSIDPAAPLDSTLSATEQDALRLALTQLRDELNQARAALSSQQAADLKEVNAKLVVAAMRSDSIAEAALNNLSELALSSYRDVLSGLPNRLLMRDHLDAAIAISRRDQTRFAVFFLDFDNFRQINRTLGHGAGDDVLRLGAQRLGSVIRQTDTLSRHGGDEFLALITQLARPDAAAHVAREMLHNLAQPADIAGRSLTLSASIGIALYPEDGQDAETLIHHADVAMYRAKSAGPGTFRFFHPSDLSASADALAPLLADPARVKPTPKRPKRVAVAGENRSDSVLLKANTQLLLAALQAQEQEQQVREAQHQQVQFMAMVVHELRHPLTPLMLAAEMLGNQDAYDTATLKSLQAIVDHQVTRLSRLIGDLLDGTRIGTSKLRLLRERMDLVDAVRDAVDATRPLFTLRHQSLQVDLPSSPIEFTGDPVRLAQVFCNLLDNATKYCPEGGQTTITAAVLDATVVITVTDTGIGIAPDALDSIFGLFVQDDRSQAYSRGGLGIGLALVRELVQAHGGSVTVRSAGTDLGSTFIVTLPLPLPDDAPADKDASSN